MKLTSDLSRQTYKEQLLNSLRASLKGIGRNSVHLHFKEVQATYVDAMLDIKEKVQEYEPDLKVLRSGVTLHFRYNPEISEGTLEQFKNLISQLKDKHPFLVDSAFTAESTNDINLIQL